MMWIQCYCWFYEFLSSKQRQLFIVLLDEFIKDMNFVGVGVEITEEIQIAVGGWAVFLVLNRPLGIHWYRGVERISIYPGNTLKTGDTLGLLADGYHYCQIHLAWEDVRDSATKATDNSNTILHEFAHALDHLDRVIDGHPTILLSEDEVNEWKRVFSADYIHAKTQKERDKLWKYFGLGAWNGFDPEDASCVDIGELFAVSTEMFFECPIELQNMAPEIYDCLMSLYRLNPIKEFPKKQKVTNFLDATLSALTRSRWM